MRSLLFSPADSERKLAKGLGSGADVLLIDLEDSVAIANKAAAREQAVQFLRDQSAVPGPQLYVRINPLDTAYWQDDLEAIVPAGADGILLPKPRGGEDVRMLAKSLDRLEQDGQPRTPVIALTSEVPIAVLRMESFVGCSDRLAGLTWERKT